MSTLTTQFDNHPSVVTLHAEPRPEKSFPCGFAFLDDAAAERGHRGALVAGQLFTIVGENMSGRTGTLAQQVAESLSRLAVNDRILVAVTEGHEQPFLRRLLLLGANQDKVRNHVRVAAVTTVAELAYFAAKVASEGTTPVALFVDDLGSLLTSGDSAAVNVLKALMIGDIASAVRVSSGMTLASFGLGAAVAWFDKMAVSVTARVRFGSSLSARAGGMRLLAESSHVIATDGTLSKSRYGVTAPEPLTEPEYFVAEDGGGDTTLWRTRPGKDPEQMFRVCDLPSAARHLFGDIAAAVSTPRS